MSNIIFNVTDWNDLEVSNNDSESENQEANNDYIIEAFGRTKNDESVYLKILDYTPFFYVEIPRAWKTAHTDKFIKYIKNKVWFKYKEGLIAHDIVKRKKLYGFRAGKRYKFLRLVFQNSTSMKKYQYLFFNKHKIFGLDNKYRNYDLYESNIPPLLRFMHIQDINASGWIEIDKNKCTKISGECHTDISIEVKWTDIKSLDDEELSKSIGPLKILSFDLECTSGDGNFPQPNRPDDKIIQIGSTFSRNGSEECYYKHIITLGSCDPIEGADVESYNTEQEVLMAWQKLVIREDPDIITGWNIFGFDERYLYERGKLLGINNKFGKLGKKRGQLSTFVEKKLSSSALGDNTLRYYDTTGRVQIDLMKVVQRDYKLSSYKLDSVAEHFLTSSITNIIDNDQLEVDQIKDLSVGNYIKLIDSNGDAINDSEKFRINNIKDSIITINKEIDKKVVKWALAKDDVSPNDIFRLQEGSSADRKIVAEYCIQDCALVNKLMARLCVVTNNIGMSNVCNIPLSFLFFRGQGIKIFSLVAKFCRKNNFLIPVIKKNKIGEDANNIGYEGATVFKPIIGFYKRPIVVNDYSSLYPSSMIHKNLSHETFVDDPLYDNHPDYVYYDSVYNNSDGTKTKCRFAKHKDGTKGLMPNILDTLLKQRKATKKLMANEQDPFKKSIYDGLQLAYKTTANSLYGQMGSSYSQIYFKEIAASTTSTGREMLEFARDYMENVFPPIVIGLYEAITEDDNTKIKEILDKELVQKLHTEEYINKLKKNIIKVLSKCSIEPKTIYGDTDSVFIDYQLRLDGKFYETREALEFAIILGQISGDFVKSHLDAPHDLEYEKTFWPFCILSKKRYVGNKYEFNKDKFKQNSMGIVLKRRDNANIVKRVVGGMVDILLNDMDVEGAVEFVRSSIENLLKNKYPLTDFATSKSLRGTYKDRSRMPHVCLADRMKLRDPGNAPQVNERVQYIAIVTDKDGVIKRKLKDFKERVSKLCEIYINYKSIYKKDGLSKLVKEFKKIESTKRFQDGIDDLYKKLSRDIKETNDRKGYINSMSKTIKYALLDYYKPRVLQGDCVEHPSYIRENNLRVDFLFYLTNQIQNPTVQFLELLVDNPNEIFNQAINIENNRRTGNLGLSKYFKINKSKDGIIKGKINLNLKKKSTSKNLIKYYLNESDEDPDKLGLNTLNNESEDEEDINISDDEQVDTKKYDKLFMSLGRI